MISMTPVRKQLLVKASQARAFAVFTENMSRWWPATHSILKSPLKECIVEPRVGGRWYSVGEDGSSCQNGYVISWQPPHGLVLAWQINADWQFDPDLITEVEVKFIAESGQTTRVELEHRLLERMGAKAAVARNAVDSPGGWTAILDNFKKDADVNGGSNDDE
jgi:uncharacterized protein YndB with AHSA1/START domain